MFRPNHRFEAAKNSFNKVVEGSISIQFIEINRNGTDLRVLVFGNELKKLKVNFIINLYSGSESLYKAFSALQC